MCSRPVSCTTGRTSGDGGWDGSTRPAGREDHENEGGAAVVGLRPPAARLARTVNGFGSYCIEKANHRYGDGV